LIEMALTPEQVKEFGEASARQAADELRAYGYTPCQTCADRKQEDEDRSSQDALFGKVVKEAVRQSKLMRAMGMQLANHAHCPDHTDRVIGCPFCDDREVYQKYESFLLVTKESE
jgi:hypothetical protein